MTFGDNGTSNTEKGFSPTEYRTDLGVPTFQDCSWTALDVARKTPSIIVYHDRYVSARPGARLSDHLTAKMQVTKRVPRAVHFVNARNLTAPSQVEPILLQASRIRRADCNFRFNTVAPFSCSATRHVEGRLAGTSKEPLQEGDGAVKTDINQAIAQEKEKQTRAPWHREGSNKPPVARQRSAGAMTKGTGMRTFPSDRSHANGEIDRQTPNNPLPTPKTHHPSDHP